MAGHTIDVAGKDVWLTEIGTGSPLLYLHGITDLHGIEADPMLFHNAGCGRLEQHLPSLA